MDSTPACLHIPRPCWLSAAGACISMTGVAPGKQRGSSPSFSPTPRRWGAPRLILAAMWKTTSLFFCRNSFAGGICRESVKNLLWNVDKTNRPMVVATDLF